MFNFNHLYYFHVTAAEGAVKAAAERLGVSQPTVSEQLRTLERTLGVQLFERTPVGLKLTQAGRDAYEHTTAMFLAGERLLESLGGDVEPAGVTLRVGVSATTARTVAADFLLPVLTMEECRPSIRSGDFNDLLRDLRAHELDLIVGETEPLALARAGLAVTLVDRPSLVAVVHPQVEPASDWSNLSLLEFRTASIYHWEVDAYLRDRSLRPKLAGELDDAFLMLEAALRGDFVAFVPRGVAREALRANRVKQLAALAPESAGVYAVYPEDDTLVLARTAVEKLVASAKAQLGGT